MVTERVTPTTGRRHRAAQIYGLATFIICLATHVVASLIVGSNGWDDGAITLAFAKTFSEHGIVALTPTSEVVEGYSSPLWFAVMAGLNQVFGFGFDEFYTASQMLASLFAACAATLLYVAIKNLHVRPSIAAAIGISVMAVGPFLHESFNGMEMNALTAIAIGVYILLTRKQYIWAAAVVMLVPFVRLEATAYIGVAAIVLLLLAKHRKVGLHLLGGIVVGLVMITMIRLAVFDDFIPNTLHAKQWEPYSPSSAIGFVRLRVDAAVELCWALLIPLTFLAFGLIAGRNGLVNGVKAAGLQARTLARDHAGFTYAAAYVLGVCLVNLALGKNWGYQCRMEASMIPLAVIVVVSVFATSLRLGVDQGPTSPSSALPLLVVFAIGLTLSGLGIIAKSATTSEKLWVSAAQIAETGRTFDRIRTELGLETMKVATPDVGGTALCCPNLEILDLGLLANSALAHDGYSATNAYLAKERPEIIETHDVWTDVSEILETPTVMNEYVPVVVDGIPLLIRQDVAEALHARS